MLVISFHVKGGDGFYGLKMTSHNSIQKDSLLASLKNH